MRADAPLRFWRAAAVVAATLCALWLAQPGAAAARVPQGFVGVVIDGPVYPNPAAGVDLQQQFGLMVASGVESIRLVFDWSYAQRYHTWSQVPASLRPHLHDVAGVPTDFSQIDGIVGLAAAKRVSVLPVVIYAPTWDAARHPTGDVAIPARDGPYATFVKALALRYGPHGEFWKTHAPAMPIRVWQIWNEPSIPYFWPNQPFPTRYVGLLKAARRAIKSVDPGARIMLAGLPNASWVDLGRIYKVPGARKLFDIVAVHPYTKHPAGVITILNDVRGVMNQAGDTSKPMVASEVSWPSSLGKTPHTVGFDFATTEAGQAHDLAAVLPLLVSNRARLGLLGFDWDTWAGRERRGNLPFDFAGLLRYHKGTLVRKPVYKVFKQRALRLEGCRQKGAVATVCSRPV